MSVTISGTTGVSKVQANTVDTTELVDDAVNAAKLDSTASPEFAGVYLGGTGAANYLDDYEEGTWTPTLSGTGSSPSVTYSTQIGTYVKIGKTVIARLSIAMSNYSGGSGHLLIDGLPFHMVDTSFPGTITGDKLSLSGNIGAVRGYDSNSLGILYSDFAGGNWAWATPAMFTAGSDLESVIVYEIA